MDVFSKRKRSSVMSRVKGKNTRPEMVVRSLVHRMGYRFRLHRRDLPGIPDVVLAKHRKVIFVHGCFWHGHRHCRRASRPISNRAFWDAKLDGNIERDRRFQRELKRLGWDVLVVWQCETRDSEALVETLQRFLGENGH